MVVVELQAEVVVEEDRQETIQMVAAVQVGGEDVPVEGQEGVVGVKVVLDAIHFHHHVLQL